MRANRARSEGNSAARRLRGALSLGPQPYGEVTAPDVLPAFLRADPDRIRLLVGPGHRERAPHQEHALSVSSDAQAGQFTVLELHGHLTIAVTPIVTAPLLPEQHEPADDIKTDAVTQLS